MYYSAIGILAVLILFIVNNDILFGRRASFDKPAWKMYRKFLFVVLLYYITDILWGLFESRKLAAPLFADTTLYYIATAAIRALKRADAKRIPIIALTANAFDEDVQRSLQAGMNAHLSKPVESDHMIRVLGELVYKAEEA